MHPIITIFCPFTRWWATEKWIEDLKNVDHDPGLTNLCFIIDGDQALIANTLKRFSEENNYRSCHIKINHDWNGNEMQIAIRRARIAEVKNQSKELVSQTDGEFIIGLEDDTDFSRLENFNGLINPMLHSKKVGFVEGVEMGRWGANIIGAWLADDFNDPKEIKTLFPLDKDPYVSVITGGGWYGYATRRDLYLNCEYYTSTAQPWGPDVNYGFWLNQKGYSCVIDWNIIFGHRDFNKTLWHNEHKLIQVVYTKNPNTGKWDRTDNG